MGRKIKAREMSKEKRKKKEEGLGKWKVKRERRSEWLEKERICLRELRVCMCVYVHMYICMYVCMYVHEFNISAHGGGVGGDGGVVVTQQKSL